MQNRIVMLVLVAWALSAPASAENGGVFVPRSTSEIVIDGVLDDAVWKTAARLDRFYETNPGNNVEPRVRTVALVTYDARYLYVAVQCDDPNPSQIRAPYVDRDNIAGDQDNIALMLDTRNDERTALQLRVNPRGIQADAVNNDATGSEDFSPDFFYDTAARITATGWTAEYRIPFSSLRYADAEPHTFGIMVIRNYPRDFRYQINSSPQPRGSNCFICHETKLVGLVGLPSGNHLVAAPYATAKESGARTPNGPFANGAGIIDLGLDAKWTPNADTSLDAAANPDFSQVESDVGQLTVNTRFAPFYPEKRPFFLEGQDLFETPIRAVYTRTITSPSWGVRATGRHGASTYTALVADDRGGGSVLLPGPTSSDLAPQDFRSVVAIGRLRQEFGASYAGVLVTDRELQGGSYNRIVGPDVQWRPRQSETVSAQLLVSDTRDLRRPDLAPQFTGGRMTSHALDGKWNHTTETWDWTFEHTDIGRDFRADDGFVPQTGYRKDFADAGFTWYRQSAISAVRPGLTVSYASEPDGRIISRSAFPNVRFFGKWAMIGTVELHPAERTRVGDRVIDTTFAAFTWQARPSRRLPNVTLTGHLGQDLDVVNLRRGSGGELNASATIRPTPHLELQLNEDHQWLSVAAAPSAGRLFTADISRLKATYTFTARSFLRVIGQYESIEREPNRYLFTVSPRDGSFTGSVLYAYKVNWQSVLFVGYQDDAALLQPTNDLVRTDRQVFVKVSYAYQR